MGGNQHSEAGVWPRLWGLQGATDLTTPYHILDSEDLVS